MADHFQNSQWHRQDVPSPVKMFSPNQYGQSQPHQQPPFTNQPPMAAQNTAANGFEPNNMWPPAGEGGAWGSGGPASIQQQQLSPKFAPVQNEPMSYNNPSTFAAAPVSGINSSPQQLQPWSTGEAVMNGPTVAMAGGSQFTHNAPYAYQPQPGQFVDQPYNPGMMTYQPDTLNNSGGSQYTDNSNNPGDSVKNLNNKMEEVNLNDSSAYSNYSETPRQDHIMPASNSFSNLQHQPSPFDSLGDSPSLTPDHSQPPAHMSPGSALFPAQPVSGHSRNSSTGGLGGGVEFIVGSNSSSTSPSNSHSPTGQSSEDHGQQQGMFMVNSGPPPPPESSPQMGAAAAALVISGSGPPPPGPPAPGPLVSGPVSPTQGQIYSPERPASVASSASTKETGRPSSVQSSASAEVANLMQPPGWMGQQHQPIPELQPATVDTAPPLHTGQSVGVTPPQSMRSPLLVNQSSPAAPLPLGASTGQSPMTSPPVGGTPLGASSPSAANPFRKGPLRPPYTPPQGVSQSTGTGSSAQGFHSSPISAPFSVGPINVQAHTEINPSAPSDAPITSQDTASPPSAYSIVTPEDAQPSASTDQSHNLDIYASPIVPHPQGLFKPPTEREEGVSQSHVNAPGVLASLQISKPGQRDTSDNMGQAFASHSDVSNRGQDLASHANVSDMSDNRGLDFASHANVGDNRGQGFASHTDVGDNRGLQEPEPTPNMQTPEEFKTSAFYQQQKQSENKQGTFSPPLTLWETPEGNGVVGGIQLAPVPGQSALPAAHQGPGSLGDTFQHHPGAAQSIVQGQEGRTMPGIVPLSQPDIQPNLQQHTGTQGHPTGLVTESAPLYPRTALTDPSSAYTPGLVPREDTLPTGATDVHHSNPGLGSQSALGSSGLVQGSATDTVHSDAVLHTTHTQPSTVTANNTPVPHPPLQTHHITATSAPQTTNPPAHRGHVTSPQISPQSSVSSQHSLTNTGHVSIDRQSSLDHTVASQWSGADSSQGSVVSVQSTQHVQQSAPSGGYQAVSGGDMGSVSQHTHSNTELLHQSQGATDQGQARMTGQTQVQHSTGQLQESIGQVQEPVGQLPGQVQGSVGQVQGSADHLPGQLQGSIGQFQGQMQGSVSQLPGQAQASVNQITGQMQGSVSQLPVQVNGSVGQVLDQIQGSTNQLPGQMQVSANQLPGQLQGSANQLPGQLQGSANQLPGQLQGSANQLPGQMQVSANQPLSQLQRSTNQLPGQLQGSANQIASQVPPMHTAVPPNPLRQESSGVLSQPSQEGEQRGDILNPSSAQYPQQPQQQPPPGAFSQQDTSSNHYPSQQPTGSSHQVGDSVPITARMTANPTVQNNSTSDVVSTSSQEVTREMHPVQSSNASAFTAPESSQHRRNESHDSLIEEYNVDKQSGGQTGGSNGVQSSATQNQYNSQRTDSQVTEPQRQDERGGYGREDYYRGGDQQDRGRYGDSRSYEYYGRQDSRDPYGDRRYDPRYDPYRDPNFDQRYDPHRPPSRTAVAQGEYQEGGHQERSRARSRQGQQEERYGRDSSRHGRDDRARSTSRSRYEGDGDYSHYGYQERPRSRHGHEEYDYRKDRRYDQQYYDRGQYEGYEDRYQRDRYQRGYESEMRNYQGGQQQYYDQYSGHHYTQQQLDYYSRHGYYQQQSYDSSYDDRRSVHSRGSTPGFDHPAYTSNSGADHFAREFNQGGSRPSSRASATYEQSPIYSGQDVTRHGYYEQSYNQSYAGYESYVAPQPVIEPEPARRTPHKHTIPHVRASFAPNGHMVKVLANRPQDGQPATVEITEASGVCEELHLEELKLFPGPLIKGETHKNDVLRFCQNKIRELGSCVGMIDRESAQLLWRYLELLIKQNGTVVGTDLADLLMEGHEQSTQNLPLSGSSAPMETSMVTTTKEVVTQGGEGGPEGHVTSDRVVVSQAARTSALDRFRQLCLFGRKKEALEFAMKAGLWEQALFLAQRMGPRISASVYTRFMNSALSVNDPLRTMYQLMSGRQPAACTMVGDERFGDWRPHLAIVLSHPSDKPQIDYKSIVSMGDSFASRGYLYASQICYLLAGCTFQDFSKKTAKLVLLGANHSVSLEEFATNTCIQCTEIYEYALSLAKPVFCIPTLQVFKYLYTTRLVDAGLVEEALHYCEVLACTLVQNPGLYSETLVQQVADLGDRVKVHDPQRLQTDQELPDPTWLTSIQTIAQQYNSGQIQHVAPSSGTHTPAGGVDTRSSSEVAEILSSASNLGLQEATQGSDSGVGYGQGFTTDTQPTQQPQTWDTQQQPASQPATGQPLELWNAATGTWTYTETSSQGTVYQQPQEVCGVGEEGSAPQWGQTAQGYQTMGGYTDYSQQPQTGQQPDPSQQQLGNQSYMGSSDTQPGAAQYPGQEVLHSVPEHLDAEGGVPTQAPAFDYYGQASSTHYDQTSASKTALLNGNVRYKSSESSDSASDSETDSTNSASTVNDTTQPMLTPRQQLTLPRQPQPYHHQPPPPPQPHNLSVYTGYKASSPANQQSGTLQNIPPHSVYLSDNKLPDIAEVSPSNTLTPTASPRQPGVFEFGITPPLSPLYRASDPSTPLGTVADTNGTEATEEEGGDGKSKKKTYWPGEDDEDSKKLMEAAKKTDPKTADKAKGEGFIRRIFGIGKKNNKEMKLPDDKNKPIVWDESKKTWIDTTSDPDSTNQTTGSVPPPKDMDFMRKMSMPTNMSAASGSSGVSGQTDEQNTSQTQGANRFSRGKVGRGARSQYVDVLKGKAKPTAAAPPNLFNILPKSQSVPANIFIPSGSGVLSILSPVADAAIDHHSHHNTPQQDTSQTANQTDTQSSSQPPQDPHNTAPEQDNQPKAPTANQSDATQNYYQQNYNQSHNSYQHQALPTQEHNQSQNSYQHQAPPTQEHNQSQNSYQQQAPPPQDYSQSQQQPADQSFGQSMSAFKQPVLPPNPAADQSEASTMPQFFNPASINMKPQLGASRLSRYGQGSRRPQYPKQQ